MNEKEIEKMEKRFFKYWIEWRDDVNQDSMRISEQIRPLRLWRHMEKELKEAYYQGYRKAGDHFEEWLSQQFDDLSTDKSPFTQDSLDEFYKHMAGTVEAL